MGAVLTPRTELDFTERLWDFVKGVPLGGGLV